MLNRAPVGRTRRAAERNTRTTSEVKFKAHLNMKTTITLVALIGALLSAHAQGTFKASLSTSPPENAWFPAFAEFTLDGSSNRFNITFGYEYIIPTSARLVGTNSEFTFDLGPALIVIHSPGGPDGWPDGYDGSTSFFGSFLLADNLREDFVAGRTTLLLLGSGVGDFRGAVLPTSRPLIRELDRQGSTLRFRFTAEVFYRYTVEYTESVGARNWLPLTNYVAKLGNFEAVVTDSVTNAGARFYRIRKEFCACR